VYRRELETALAAAAAASAVILDFYNAKSAETYMKSDGSPVTDADLASDRTIREMLGSAFPDDALLTEEGAKDEARLAHSRVWIVDPIDGTAQYIARTGEFDVLIALTVDGRPVVAASANPPSGRFVAAVKGAGAWEIDGDRVTPFAIGPAADPPRVVSSVWYGAREEAGRGGAVTRIAGRLNAVELPTMDVGYHARRFLDPVRTYDAYIGLPPPTGASIAQEWDLACVELITTEAGGAFSDCWGREHRYNKRSTGISGGLLASADAGLHDRLLAAVAPDVAATPAALDPADDGLD
jgi:3'-phosphoadenosine 5'-phosphosulfate (PAPS) 3'-phosphatase